MLTLKNLTYRIAGRTLLDSASLQLDRGQKIGLVGRNGIGKSTLFRLILGQIHADGGNLNFAQSFKIATVAQEAPGGDASALEFVINADHERTALLLEAETCEDPDRIGEIHDRLMNIDAYTAEARAARILLGLGFSEADQHRSLSSFSGGWRMRIALAASLFQHPDLLLLDEPTNHLDLEASIWLENFLKSYNATLLIVSHDREFLNNVVTKIFHLHRGKITTYNGNYDFYEKTRKEQLAFGQAYNEKIEAQKKHMMKFVDRFRASATKARQAQSRLKAVEKLEPLSLAEDDPTLKLDFPETEALAPPYATYDKVSLGYDDKVILHSLRGTIGPEDRIALLGANGNGKSTFAKFLAGRLKPQAGHFHLSPKLRVGYFHQHQVEDLKKGDTAYHHVADLMPNASETVIRSFLGRFGFDKIKSDVAVEKLSGGEKARLVMALISSQKPHLLIFDEPTNHLDVEMRESLMMSINNFAGAVILITHDWHLLRHTADRLWLVAEGTIRPYEGDLEDYRKEVLGGSKKEDKGKGKKK
jgi:ATP-binding cassette subfamily F protein 3